MVLLFLPAVAHIAVEAPFAATAVVSNGDVVLGLPVVARDGLVAILVGPPPVVLPVVRVDALGRVVFGQVVRAEPCLVEEHVKIFIFRVVVDEGGEDFFLVVSV